MNLTQISVKYNISESFLNSKEDAIVIAIKSLEDVMNEIISKQGDKSVHNKLKHLQRFLMDVKSSTIS